jgi:hypothetical protein
MAVNNTRFVAAQLRRLPLFARLTPDQLERAASVAQVVQAAAGMALAAQGQPATAMFMFVSGRGILTRATVSGTEEQVAIVQEGQYVGEEALYSERIQPYTIRAAEPALVLVIPKAALAQQIVESPEMRANIGMTPPSTRAATRIFKGQRDNETVLHIFKRHWWSFARQVWLPMLIAFAFIIAGVLAIPSQPGLSLFLFVAGLLLPGGLCFLLYADWQDDCLIVTNQRIVKIYDNLFTLQKTVNEIPFERAHEVNAEIPPDPFARLFGYGTVIIKTAGAAGTITIDTLPNPQRIQQVIFSERDKHKQTSGDDMQQMISREVDSALGIPAATLQTPAPARRLPAAPSQPADLLVNPLRTRFMDDDGGMVYRRHLSIWLRGVTAPLAVMLGAMVVGIGALFIPTLQQYGVLAFIGAGGVFLLGAVWFYLADWDWRQDMLIVGRDTVTIIHKRPLWLQNEVEQIRLSQIDNVFSEVVGLVNSLLNRGTIRISLIGGDIDDAKRFDGMGDPQSVQGEISRRLADLQSVSAEADAQRNRQAIAEYLAAYHQRVSQQPGYAPNPQAFAGQGYEAPDLPAPPVRDGARPPNVPRVLK